MADYVKNKDLYNELCRCQDVSINYSLELHEMFQKMVDKFSYKFSYKFEDDRKDCKSMAIEDLYRYWTNFDRNKTTNAFAYITQIIKNGYAKGWRSLYPHGFESSNKVRISIYNIWNL